MKRRYKTKYSIGNKKIIPNSLHGIRFMDWFDREFGLKDEPAI